MKKECLEFDDAVFESISKVYRLYPSHTKLQIIQEFLKQLVYLSMTTDKQVSKNESEQFDMTFPWGLSKDKNTYRYHIKYQNKRSHVSADQLIRELAKTQSEIMNMRPLKKWNVKQLKWR